MIDIGETWVLSFLQLLTFPCFPMVSILEIVLDDPRILDPGDWSSADPLAPEVSNCLWPGRTLSHERKS